MKIFLNPGHAPDGNPDPGACGNGLRECDVAKSVADLVERYLEAFSVEVVGNLQHDDLGCVCDEANASGADAFVSIHCNSGGGTGTETFYYEHSTAGQKLAKSIQGNIIDALPLRDRGLKTKITGSSGRQFDVYVCANTNMPGVLVELAFIDNANDAALLRDRQDSFAQAIAKGIAEYGGIPTASQIPEETSQPAKPHDSSICDEKTAGTSQNAETASQNDIEKIAVLARKYESNGDPACVSSGVGDLGGISYGLYQFSSKVGVAKAFVDWLCQYHDPAFANYGKVLAAHEVNSPGFIQQWKDLGTVDPGGFGKLQDEYIMEMFYNKAAQMLAKEGYSIGKHTDAMKAVLLSRAVQNGITGAKSLFNHACVALGHPNVSYVDDAYFDHQLIASMYDFLVAECDSAQHTGNGVWRSANDFVHGSRAVVNALKSRFRREKEDALEMLND